MQERVIVFGVSWTAIGHVITRRKRNVKSQTHAWGGVSSKQRLLSLLLVVCDNSEDFMGINCFLLVYGKVTEAVICALRETRTGQVMISYPLWWWWSPGVMMPQCRSHLSFVQGSQWATVEAHGSTITVTAGWWEPPCGSSGDVIMMNVVLVVTVSHSLHGLWSGLKVIGLVLATPVLYEQVGHLTQALLPSLGRTVLMWWFGVGVHQLKDWREDFLHFFMWFSSWCLCVLTQRDRVGEVQRFGSLHFSAKRREKLVRCMSMSINLGYFSLVLCYPLYKVDARWQYKWTT